MGEAKVCTGYCDIELQETRIFYRDNFSVAVIGIDSGSSCKPTGSSQTSALKRCREVSSRREQESRYLFHSCLRTIRLGCRLISYLKPRVAASVFAANCGIALQEPCDPGGVTQLLADNPHDAPVNSGKTARLKGK
jgi:hypothetical protein